MIKNTEVSKKWLNIGMFNFILVAAVGVLMRYKIGFEFPFLDQQHLQHAHSHFAFYGWVSHCIMTFMIAYIQNFSDRISPSKYYTCLGVNLFASYGMLLGFAILGYHPITLIFSFLAILVSYFFTYFFLKDFKPIQLKSGVSLWFRAALLASVISSLGNYYLAYMMLSHHFTQHGYLLSVYFYLHFQYNGWFFFSLVGLTILFFRTHLPTFTLSRTSFWLFTLSCIPAYFLSALWLKLPVWIYGLIVLAAITQCIAWVLILRRFVQAFNHITPRLHRMTTLTLCILAIAISIKLGLQLGSVIPAVSKLAFGFRTIIIAYLHLVLLAIVSLFLVFYQLNYQKVFSKRPVTILFGLFFVAIYTNQLLLGLQGVASFIYLKLPFWNIFLFIISLILFTLLLGLFIVLKTDDKSNLQI